MRARSPAPVIAAVAQAAARYGLKVSGAFHPAVADGVPAAAQGLATRTLVLLGNAGAAMWAAFYTAPESTLATDPLDTWSRRVIGTLAADLGAAALFPFSGPPFLPFGRWAKRNGAVHESPLGILIHPVFGLWHGYRGALAFADRLALPPPSATRNPCETCLARPCLTACPVGAFSAAGYAMEDCLDHLRSEAGAGCREGGCRARLVCPVGAEYRYPPAQMRFHLRQFVASQERLQP